MEALCRGYLVPARGESGEYLERLYAVCPDGKVLEAVPVKYSAEFEKGRSWFDSDVTADEIKSAKSRFEFIGNYPVPTRRTK